MSTDFYKTIPPISFNVEKKWYQCGYCLSDLRSGKHDPNCDEPVDSKFPEVERVSFVVRQMFKSKGLRVIQGGRVIEEKTI